MEEHDAQECLLHVDTGLNGLGGLLDSGLEIIGSGHVLLFDGDGGICIPHDETVAIEDGTQHVVLGSDSVKGRLQGSFVDTFAAMQHHALQIVGGLGQMQVFEVVDDGRVTHFPTPRLLTDGNS